MKKYIDSKNGIYTDGYNHYVVDLAVYPFLTNAATIDNADEIIGIFNKVHAHGGQLTAVQTASTTVAERSVTLLTIDSSTKELNFVVGSMSATYGAITMLGTGTYSSGTWTMALKTATTAWDT